uniref:Uncharacterized protein n=1 Tax=Cannabis sativa TaxID=3483 RepID=A0A803NW77_CANSA
MAVLHAELWDISNESYAPRKTYCDAKLIRKVLGILPRRNPNGSFKQGQQFGDKKNAGIQCQECDGFEHIQAECANTLKKEKVLVATWSDSDEEKSSMTSENSEEGNQVMAFMDQSHHSICSEEDANSSSSRANNEERWHTYEDMFGQ